MKPKAKLSNLNLVETELEIILACPRKPKTKLGIPQIFDFLAENIELSLQVEERKEELGFLQKILGRYKLKKVLSGNGFQKQSQIYNFPSSSGEFDPKVSESRLKTAITAFRLHSGPFGDHRIYGTLDKPEWEKLHCYLCEFMFSLIVLENDEKIRFQKEKEFKKEMHHKEQTDSPQRRPNKHWKGKKRHHKGNRR